MKSLKPKKTLILVLVFFIAKAPVEANSTNVIVSSSAPTFLGSSVSEPQQVGIPLTWDFSSGITNLNSTGVPEFSVPLVDVALVEHEELYDKFSDNSLSTGLSNSKQIYQVVADGNLNVPEIVNETDAQDWTFSTDNDGALNIVGKIDEFSDLNYLHGGFQLFQEPYIYALFAGSLAFGSIIIRYSRSSTGLMQ